MSSQKNKKTDPKRKSRTPRKYNRRKLCAIVGGLVATVAVVVGIVFFSAEPKSATESIPSTTVPSGEEKPDFYTLIGKWVRPDGGYIIAVRKVDPAGQVAVAYFNPRPINVSQARVSFEGKTMRLFIELQDEGYPGSTYDLLYTPDSDRLAGSYFQAALQRWFDVMFVRLR
jgi:hypothetical protein